jgi:hyaluronoglucosaminidase
MDETWLRALLEQAVANEPPAGPVVSRSIAKGIRLRRRRRVRTGTSFAAFAAVIVAAGVAIPTHLTGSKPTPPSAAAIPPTLYVVSEFLAGPAEKGAVTPISASTGAVGRVITTGESSSIISTPDGRTVYVDSGGVSGWVQPISATTGAAGRPIMGVPQPEVMAITPDGKTVYVTTIPGTVTPISVATDRAGRPIAVAQDPEQIVITPDGKRAYVLSAHGTVTPIVTATNRAGGAIPIAGILVGPMVLAP